MNNVRRWETTPVHPLWGPKSRLLTHRTPVPLGQWGRDLKWAGDVGHVRWKSFMLVFFSTLAPIASFMVVVVLQTLLETVPTFSSMKFGSGQEAPFRKSSCFSRT